MGTNGTPASAADSIMVRDAFVSSRGRTTAIPHRAIGVPAVIGWTLTACGRLVASGPDGVGPWSTAAEGRDTTMSRSTPIGSAIATLAR